MFSKYRNTQCDVEATNGALCDDRPVSRITGSYTPYKNWANGMKRYMVTSQTSWMKIWGMFYAVEPSARSTPFLPLAEVNLVRCAAGSRGPGRAYPGVSMVEKIGEVITLFKQCRDNNSVRINLIVGERDRDASQKYLQHFSVFGLGNINKVTIKAWFVNGVAWDNFLLTYKPHVHRDDIEVDAVTKILYHAIIDKEDGIPLQNFALWSSHQVRAKMASWKPGQYIQQMSPADCGLIKVEIMEGEDGCGNWMVPARDREDWGEDQEQSVFLERHPGQSPLDVDTRALRGAASRAAQYSALAECPYSVRDPSGTTYNMVPPPPTPTKNLVDADAIGDELVKLDMGNTSVVGNEELQEKLKRILRPLALTNTINMVRSWYNSLGSAPTEAEVTVMANGYLADANWKFYEKEEDTSPRLRNEVDFNVDVDINDVGEVRTYPLRSQYRGRRLFVSSEGAEGSLDVSANNNKGEAVKEADDVFDDEWRGGFFKHSPRMATDGFGFLATKDRSIHTVSTASSSSGDSMVTQTGKTDAKKSDVSLHLSDVQGKCFRRY